VLARQRAGRRRRLKGKRGRGTALDEKNPVFGMVAREGQVILRVLENVRQVTIRPIITQHIEVGTKIYTDEYNIYHRLSKWGYQHQIVEHGKGEYARDEDGDGFCEVHCNTIEGIWSLLRSWLRPHRGVSQEKLPFYVGFFEWIYNLKKRGQKALKETLKCLLEPDKRTYQECILNFSLKVE
jgi:transposase